MYKQDADGNGVFETNIRTYTFTYAPDTTSGGRLWVNVDYSAGGKMLTLNSVQESVGTTSPVYLPAQTFTYNGLHLTKADNGYGGTVQFTYDTTPYYTSIAPPSTDPFNLTDDYIRTFNGCTGGTGTVSEVGWVKKAGNTLSCNGKHLIVAGGTTAAPAKVINTVFFPTNNYNLRSIISPGSAYEIDFSATNVSGVFNTGIWFNPGSLTSAYLQLGGANDTSHIVILSKLATETVRLYLQTTGSADIYSATVKMRPTYYRVNTKTVGDNNYHTYTTSYIYGVAKVGATDYKFYGHDTVTEIAPDNTQTVTSFYQDDVKKGRVQSVTVKDPNGTLRSKTINTYAQKGYAGYEHAWVYLDSQINRIYDTGGSYVGTRTEYDYDTELHDTGTFGPSGTYGNLTEKREYASEAGTTYYRKTVIEYRPNATTYVVGAPAEQVVYDASGTTVLADTMNFYDYATGNTAPPTKGLLTMTKVKADSRYIWTIYGYDTFGNQTSVKTYSGYNASGTEQATYTCYGGGVALNGTPCADDGYHTYPLWTKNAAGHTISFDYFDSGTYKGYRYGSPMSLTDANAQVTQATYDVFGRMQTITRPGDTSATLTMTYNDASVTPPAITTFVTSVTQKIDNTQVFTLTRTYDGIGREIQTDAGGITTYTVYSSPTTTLKTTPNDPSHYSATSVDLNTRTTTFTEPDGSFSTTTVNGLTTTVTDANGHVTTTTKDVRGRVTDVLPPTGPAVHYTYNELDQLTQVDRGGVTTMTMTYDNLGRKLTMDDGDMGVAGTFTDQNWAWNYQYDPSGNLMSQTDARSCTTNLYYDNLSRLTYKSYSGCPTTPAVTYVYDQGVNGIGKRTSMSSGDTSASWMYDNRGRLYNETKNVSGTVASTYYKYNSADLLETMTYPGGEEVHYTYNTRMLLNTVIGDNSYVSSTTYEPAGRVDDRVLGNGLTQDFRYNPWNVQNGRLQKIITGTLQDVAYTYDPAGNIKTITDAANAGQKQCFQYDALDRLTAASTYNDSAQGCASQLGQGNYEEAYGYDGTTGNLSSKTGINYTYDATHKHAVSGLTNGNAYGYDANGNQTTRNNNYGANATLTYDAENRLTHVNVTADTGQQVNLALGKNATQSSTYSTMCNSSAFKAVDGNTSGYFPDCTSAFINLGFQPWWEVDLGTVGNISNIQVWNRTDCCGERLSDYYVLVSDVPFASKDLAATLSQPGVTGIHMTSQAGSPTTVPVNRTGRYVRVQLAIAEYNYFAIAEVQVFGTSPSQALSADFTYDGDGNRVKAVENGVTTLFFGSHFEITNPGAGQTVTKYYFAGASRIAMRKYVVPQSMSVEYFLSDNLGSTSVTTDSTGVKISEMRYKPWGEVRSAWTNTAVVTTPAYQLTRQTFTGQYSYSDDLSTPNVTEGFGLMFYNARWYDSYLNHFTQPDSIVPDPYNSQDYDRYSYVRNNPLRYSDPTGHKQCSIDKNGGCDKKEELWNYAYDTLDRLGGKNDREAAARIVEKAAGLYRTYDKMIPELTEIFNGFNESNPFTLFHLLFVDGCAGVGREAGKDCKSNTADESFWDRGYNKDFRDSHNQIFHYWAYLTTTASTDYPIGGYAVGYFTDQIGNIAHEILGVGDPQGASWQDYALAEAGLNTGVMISFGLIPPNQLGNYIRNDLATGAPYVAPLIQYLPLSGNQR